MPAWWRVRLACREDRTSYRQFAISPKIAQLCRTSVNMMAIFASESDLSPPIVRLRVWIQMQTLPHVIREVCSASERIQQLKHMNGPYFEFPRATHQIHTTCIILYHVIRTYTIGKSFTAISSFQIATLFVKVSSSLSVPRVSLNAAAAETIGKNNTSASGQRHALGKMHVRRQRSPLFVGNDQGTSNHCVWHFQVSTA